MWITEIHGQAGGLLQCYLHADYPQHDASVGIAAAVGIDYLLGGAHRGQGLGALVVSAFAAHAFDQHPSAATCIATPAQANTASWRALERAGFTRHGECQPPDQSIAFIYATARRGLTAHADRSTPAATSQLVDPLRNGTSDRRGDQRGPPSNRGENAPIRCPIPGGAGRYRDPPPGR